MRDKLKKIRRQIRRANMSPEERKARKEWLRAHMGVTIHPTAKVWYTPPKDKTAFL